MRRSEIQKKYSPKPSSSDTFFRRKGEEGLSAESKIGDKPFFSPGTIQPKLKVGSPNDSFEKEADMVAAKVVGQMAKPKTGQTVQAKTEPEAEDDLGSEKTEEREISRKPIFESEGTPMKGEVQTKKEGNTGISPPPKMEGQLTDSKSKGQSMSEEVKEPMETAFGTDFKNVKIHVDSEAAQMSQNIQAKAFTHGSDIYFNKGMYDPNSESGNKLIAHELTHVVQQSGGGTIQRQGNSDDQISRAPDTTIQREIQDVQPGELTTYFSQPEQSQQAPILSKYLTENSLMTVQRRILGILIRRVRSGMPPLTASQLQALVLNEESNLGTALIICHNITRALARGSTGIGWQNVSRDPDPLVYSLNGTSYTFDPSTFHEDAVEFGSRNQQSVFYAMLSTENFGYSDEGDWYHFFAMAATTYYHTSGNFSPDGPNNGGQITPALVNRVIDQLRDPTVNPSSAYEGWLRANAMSFLEGGFYGRSQDEVNSESAVQIQGASAGIATQGLIPDSNWKWLVPNFGTISLGDFGNFQLRPNMIQAVRTGLSGNFNLIIVSGTTPSHWYDAPDSFVTQPGWTGSKTSTIVDNASPVWNELLDSYTYSQLASVALLLYDEDPLINDLVTTFRDDLRPTNGRTSETFSISSGTSTLLVRIEAKGYITLANP